MICSVWSVPRCYRHKLRIAINEVNLLISWLVNELDGRWDSGFVNCCYQKLVPETGDRESAGKRTPVVGSRYQATTIEE
jgi:hypothetical protein